MPKYTYISRDPQGQRVTAIMEAETRQALLNELKERGLTVIEIKTFGEKISKKEEIKRRWSFALSFGSSIDTAEVAVFWREFATMVGAGLPIVEALESIAEELEHVKFRKILQKVIANLWEGFTFSDSLKKHSQVFSRMVVALIGAAEESGSLPEVANQLATFLENRDRLLRKVQAALTYPIFLSGFFLVVLAVSTFWIIPKFRDIYAGFNAKLPQLTQVVFDANAFILNHLVLIVIAAAVSLLLLVLWSRRPSGRAVIDRLNLRMPIFGKLFQRAAIARFCRSLAILLSGGIAINRALEMAQETSGNSVLAGAIKNSREEILKGSKISASLRQHKIFPPMTVRMIATGEETGNLSPMLEKVAEFYEGRVDAALSTINALIEPIFIVVIGMFVLVFILALYLPIFSLGAAMKG